MTLSITTLSILCHYAEHYFAKSYCTECRVFILRLSVVLNSSLLGLLISYEENKVMWIWPLAFITIWYPILWLLIFIFLKWFTNIAILIANIIFSESCYLINTAIITPDKYPSDLIVSTTFNCQVLISKTFLPMTSY